VPAAGGSSPAEAGPLAMTPCCRARQRRSYSAASAYASIGGHEQTRLRSP
jgi:hypothetical protein